MEAQQAARRILRRKSVIDRLDGISVSTLYRWMDDPKLKFPKPLKLSNAHSVVWDADQVEAWIARQMGVTQ
jgi:predicted DNA-binding transcriptional regulator AlpA